MSCALGHLDRFPAQLARNLFPKLCGATSSALPRPWDSPLPKRRSVPRSCAVGVCIHQSHQSPSPRLRSVLSVLSVPSVSTWPPTWSSHLMATSHSRAPWRALLPTRVGIRTPTAQPLSRRRPRRPAAPAASARTHQPRRSPRCTLHETESSRLQPPS